MADTMLAPSPTSFAQDRVGPLARRGTLPGWRRLDGVGVVSLRHGAASASARAALAAAGLAWPEPDGEIRGDLAVLAAADRSEAASGESAGGLVAVRQHPEAAVLLGTAISRLDAVLAALAPRPAVDAFAIDLSDGTATLALEGSGLDAWLTRLIDSTVLPLKPGTATRARFADIAAVLLRLAPETLWLVVDRALAAYAGEWLTYAHAGAFGAPAGPTPP